MAPLTHEQIQLIADETSRASAKVLKRYTRAAAGAFLLLLATSAFVYQTGQNASDDSRRTIVASGQVVAVDGCNRDFRSGQALRGLLLAAKAIQQSEFEKGRVTKEQLAVGDAFYDSQLKLLKLPDCEAARRVLTSDPDAKLRTPVPLRP